MKRFLYVFALLFVFAEASAKVNYSIGFKGGLAFGRFKNFNLEGSKKSSLGGQYSSRVGLSGAITGRIWFNKYIGLEAGAEFNMGGNTSTWQQQNFYGQFKKEVKETKLSKEEQLILSKYAVELEKLEVYYLSDIMQLLDQIEESTSGIKQWKADVKIAVESCNETRYQKLIEKVRS